MATTLGEDRAPGAAVQEAAPADLEPADVPPHRRFPPPAVAAAWSAFVFLPILVLVVRIATTRQRVFLNGDTALLDVQAHRAAAWQQLLGPYDRFGWHHPGPIYLYLISFVERVLGSVNAAQAQECTALLVNGLAIAGAVFVLGRHLGSRVSMWSAGVGLVLIAGVGPSGLFNAWNPYVVLLPLVLCGILASFALLGSITAFWAAALVGTFAVQTDVGTLPLVLVLVAGAGVALVVRVMRRQPSQEPLVISLVLAALTAGCWIPVIYQQLTGSPGNLSTLARFFLHARPRAGLATGASAAGYAFSQPLGLQLSSNTPRGSSLIAWLNSQIIVTRWPGVVAVAIAIVVIGVLVWTAQRNHARAATVVGGASAVGLVVSIAAGASIVGPPFRWLMFWAGSITGLALLCAAILLSRWEILHRLWVRRSLATGIVIAAGALGYVAATTGLGLSSNPSVGQLWAMVKPVAEHSPGHVVGLVFDAQGASFAGGLEDQLAIDHIAFTVAPQWENHFGPSASGEPSTFIGLTSKAPPQGFELLTVQQGVVISYRVEPGSSTTR